MFVINDDNANIGNYVDNSVIRLDKSGTCPLVKASLSRRQPSMTRFARLKGKRCRDSEPSPEKLSGTTPFFRCAPGWLRSEPTIFPTNHRDSTLLCPRPHRGEYRLRYLQWDTKEIPLNPRVNIIYRDCVTFGAPSPPPVFASHTI